MELVRVKRGRPEPCEMEKKKIYSNFYDLCAMQIVRIQWKFYKNLFPLNSLHSSISITTGNVS